VTAYESRLEVEEGDDLVLAVSGEIDMVTATDFEQDLDRVLSAAAGDVVVDLSQLDFIDSAGLGVLMSSMRRLQEQDRRLALVILQRRVMRTFIVTGLELVVPITDSRETAWAKLAESRDG
jgi:anti-sigma B factor antagonist